MGLSIERKIKEIIADDLGCLPEEVDQAGIYKEEDKVIFITIIDGKRVTATSPYVGRLRSMRAYLASEEVIAELDEEIEKMIKSIQKKHNTVKRLKR